VQTQLHFICLTGNFRKGVVRTKQTDKEMNKLFWWLYFIISQRFAHLFKWASSGQRFQPQKM